MSDWFDQMRQLRAELREFVRQVVANAIQFTQFTRSTASGEHDKVAGYLNEGAGEQAYDYEVRRLQHFGFRSRPPMDVWALRVASSGGATNNVTVAEDSTRYGPSDLGDGEVALYCSAAGLEMRLTAEGDIDAHSAAGKLINLQGGDRGVARLNDNVACGTLIFTPSPPTLTYVPQGAPMPDPLPPGAGMIALKGIIISASEKTKTG